MVLHYAKLCALAGGVDAFLIGSELRGLTTPALRRQQSFLLSPHWRHWPQR